MLSLWVFAQNESAVCTLTKQTHGPPAGAAFDPLGADGDLGVGEIRIAYDTFTHCGVEWLDRPINGQRWHAADLASYHAVGIDPVPPRWGGRTTGLTFL